MEPLLIDNKFLVKKLNSSYNGKELYLAFEYSAFLPKGAKNFRFLLNGEELATDKFDYFILERGIGDRVTGSIVARIPGDMIEEMDVDNSLQVAFSSCFGACIADFGYRGKISLIEKVYKIAGSKSVLYISRGKSQIKLKIRPGNYTDSPREQRRLALAKVLSKFVLKKPILLFEKNSSRYEESGSAVYERLIDSGRTNCYFILDTNSPDYEKVPDKYRKNIIPRFSFKHYLYYFASKKFIGSELVPHAMEIRCISPLISQKLNRSHYDCIFLQHGVMYMVSLDSATRQGEGYNKRENREMYIVVSSNLERQHFLDCTDLEEDNLLLSGLPKMDKNYRNEDADRIAIMPTWRPWEERKCKENFTETSYYRTLKDIVDGVPASLKDKIWIMPHPLIKDYIRSQHNELEKYFAPEISYNELLRSVDILITDYSSISYDAFYRGSNIIFWWKDKDYCMESYGENTKLMLTEELAFGPVLYDKAELSETIDKLYRCEQAENYKENYSKIVEFHDNKNTDRLIRIAKEKGII